MALPALNNQNTIANLPMDANSISQAVLTAASRTGHLQIYNNGTIAFNNNITGGSAPSATKESGGFGYSEISILTEIRNYLESINGNITRFIETSQRQTEITQNLLEATNARRDIELPRTAVQEKGMDFKKTFQDFFDSMKDSFSGITGGMKGGLMGGMLGGLLKGVFGFILRGFGLVFGAYLVAKGISKIPIGGGQTIGDKIKELTENASNYISSYGDNASGRDSSSVGGSSADMGEPGEAGNEGGTSSPTGNIPNTSPTDSQNTSPSTNTPSTTRTSPTRVSSPQRSAIPSKETFTTSSDWATDADLSGITFTDHSKKGLSQKIHKQILKSLAQRLQYIKKKVGKGTLHINSGYRPEWYNRRCPGAAKNSLHIKRMAADISTSNMSVSEKKKLIVAASESGCGGIGIYGSFIHVDIGRRRTWNAIPSWAKEVINNHLAGKYKMGDEHFVDDKSASPQDAEPGEAGNNQGKTQPEGKTDTDTANQTPPSGDNVPSQQERPTADRTEPSQPVTGGEEEEEEEDTSEKVQTDPSVIQKTAVKVNSKKEIKSKSKGSAQKAMEFFSKFWTKEQAAGIVGNLQHESNNTFDPHQKQIGGGTGYGIAQWEKPRQNLFKKVMKKDIKESTFEDQLHFIQWELTHGVYKKAGNKIKNTKTVKEATLAFRAFYEIPGGNNNPDKPHKSDNQRIQYAQNAFGGISEEPQLAESNKEGGAAKPSSGQQPPGENSAQQEPQTFEDKAKRVGEAVAETAEEVWEFSKEKFEQLKKDFGPNRNTLNKVLSAGINEIYDIAKIDPRKRVKIENGKVVPYTQESTAQEQTNNIVEENGGIGDMEKQFFRPSANPVEGGVSKTGEALYSSSVGVKTGERQLIQSKSDSTSQQPIINNITQQSKQKGENPNGVMGAVPAVRQKMDSTLEQIQYRNLRGTGVV